MVHYRIPVAQGKKLQFKRMEMFKNELPRLLSPWGVKMDAGVPSFPIVLYHWQYKLGILATVVQKIWIAKDQSELKI